MIIIKTILCEMALHLLTEVCPLRIKINFHLPSEKFSFVKIKLSI